MKRKQHTEETKRKISKALKGKPSPRKGKPGKPHTEETKRKLSAARKGKPMSEKQKQKLSKANKGKPAHNKGKPLSEKQKQKISKAKKGKPGKPHTEESKRKLSKAVKGKKHTEESKRKMSESKKGKPSPHKGKTCKPISEAHRQNLSAAAQGIPYDEWESFACEKKYCPKFNEACKESNRKKYGRRCFMCNKTEKTNGQKLSVHHVDMDKAQGCENNWKLVPLCKSCHAKAHNDELIARLGYILK